MRPDILDAIYWISDPGILDAQGGIMAQYVKQAAVLALQRTGRYPYSGDPDWEFRHIIAVHRSKELLAVYGLNNFQIYDMGFSFSFQVSDKMRGYSKELLQTIVSTDPNNEAWFQDINYELKNFRDHLDTIGVWPKENNNFWTDYGSMVAAGLTFAAIVTAGLLAPAAGAAATAGEVAVGSYSGAAISYTGAITATTASYSELAAASAYTAGLGAASVTGAAITADSYSGLFGAPQATMDTYTGAIAAQSAPVMEVGEGASAPLFATAAKDVKAVVSATQAAKKLFNGAPEKPPAKAVVQKPSGGMTAPVIIIGGGLLAALLLLK